MEYGNSPGKNLPAPNKDLGFSGKNAITKKSVANKVPSSPSKGVPASPTMSQTKTSSPLDKMADIDKSDTLAMTPVRKAKELTDVASNTTIFDKNKNPLGKVVAPVGTSPQKNFLASSLIVSK